MRQTHLKTSGEWYRVETDGRQITVLPIPLHDPANTARIHQRLPTPPWCHHTFAASRIARNRQAALEIKEAAIELLEAPR